MALQGAGGVCPARAWCAAELLARRAPRCRRRGERRNRRPLARPPAPNARAPASDAAIRDRFAAALPFNDLEQMAAAAPGGAPGGPSRPAHLLRPLTRPPTPPGGAPPPPALIVVPDADASLGDLAGALAALGRRAYALDLPPRRRLARLRSVRELAALLARAVLEGAPPGPYAIAGVGMGGVVAHELAAQLQAAGQQARGAGGRGAGQRADSAPPAALPARAVRETLRHRPHEQVPVLLLIEDASLRAACDVAAAPWFQLHPLLEAWRPDADLAAFAAGARLLAAQPAGVARQLDAVAAMRPEGVAREDWEDLVGERCAGRAGAGVCECARMGACWPRRGARAGGGQRQAGGPASGAAAPWPTRLAALTPAPARAAPRRLQSAARAGLAWEETLTTWAALHAFALRCARAAAAAERPGSPEGSHGSGSGGGGGGGGGGAPAVPPLEAFLLDLFALEGDAEAQLDYAARYRPAGMGLGDWDRGVSQVRRGGGGGGAAGGAQRVQPGRGLPAAAAAPGSQVATPSHAPHIHPPPPLPPARLQLVTRVSYLKAITAGHAPDALLPWTAHVLLHAAPHRGVRDLAADGGAGGALRAVAPLLAPLRLACWRDTLPCARGLEQVLSDAQADAARAAAAARALLAAPPPPPPGVAALRRLGLGEAPPGGFVLPPPPPPQPTAPGGAAAGGGEPQPAQPLCSLAVPLNAHCFSPEVRPGAAALSRARGALALPGSDVSREEDAAQRAALRGALAAQRAAAARLPLWLVHGEGGTCGAAAAAAAAELPLPAFGLELGPGALSPGRAPASVQELAAAHAAALLAVQPAGPHILAGIGPYACLLASATACELERGGAARGGVALVLFDGAPALPAAPPPRHPAAGALFALLADAGAPPRGGARGAWAAFAAEFEAAAAAEAAAASAAGAPARAMARLAAAHRPAGLAPAAARAWDAAVEAAAAGAALVARLCEGYAGPEYVFQGARARCACSSVPARGRACTSRRRRAASSGGRTCSPDQPLRVPPLPPPRQAPRW